MSDKTIGDLPAADPLDGSDLLEIEQDGNSRQTTVSDIAKSAPMDERFAARRYSRWLASS